MYSDLQFALQESLRNGVYLAKLASFFAPAVVAPRKIFDADLAKYAAHGLHFRHTDNINYFLQVSDPNNVKLYLMVMSFRHRIFNSPSPHMATVSQS